MLKSLSLGLLLSVSIYSQSLFAEAGQSTPDPGPANRAVTVLVYNYAKVDAKTLELARKVAGQVYQNAGIEIKWRACPTTAEEIAQYSASGGSSSASDLVLRIRPAAPAQWAKRKGVFGAAHLGQDKGFARFADIYFERIENVALQELRVATEGIFGGNLSTSLLTGLTLGVVVAHEMGHLLLGTNSHSRRGIMRPNWERQDLEDALCGRQSFIPEQVPQLHVNLQAREEIASAEARF